MFSRIRNGISFSFWHYSVKHNVSFNCNNLHKMSLCYTDMKVRLYAGKINFKKKRWKKCRNTHNIFDNKMVKTFIFNSNVHSRMGYLASIMF